MQWKKTQRKSPRPPNESLQVRKRRYEDCATRSEWIWMDFLKYGCVWLRTCNKIIFRILVEIDDVHHWPTAQNLVVVPRVFWFHDGNPHFHSVPTVPLSYLMDGRLVDPGRSRRQDMRGSALLFWFTRLLGCDFCSPDFRGAWESFFLRAVVCMLEVDCSLKYVGKRTSITSCVFAIIFKWMIMNIGIYNENFKNP